MNTNEFWDVLEPGKKSDKPETSLRSELQKLSAEEIQSFQTHFDELFDKAYRWDLWGAAYVIHGGCSDDGFIDFRYALLSSGKEVFGKALENPDSLADLGEKMQQLDNEEFGYVAAEVYEKKTGSAIARIQSTDPEGNMGEEWDFDDETEVERRLPKICAVLD